jgi:CTD small phosphatase-like protein 2
VVHFEGQSCSDQIINVRFRPYLKEFLESVSKNFNLILWTAGEQKYADLMINTIDPERKLF